MYKNNWKWLGPSLGYPSTFRQPLFLPSIMHDLPAVRFHRFVEWLHGKREVSDNSSSMWNCTITGKISSSVYFTSTFKSFHMNFKICFRHLILLEMISLKTVAMKLGIHCKKTSVQSVCPLVTRTCGRFVLKTCFTSIYRQSPSSHW